VAICHLPSAIRYRLLAIAHSLFSILFSIFYSLFSGFEISNLKFEITVPTTHTSRWLPPLPFAICHLPFIPLPAARANPIACAIFTALSECNVVTL
jgi:hypothetical protein